MLGFRLPVTENTPIPPAAGKREDPPELPEVVSLLPLRNSVLFPGSIIPIDVGRPKSVKLIEEAIANERPIIGIVTQREARVEEPTEADLHSSAAPLASSRSSSSRRTTTASSSRA
jgi:ATP-dependent Lon protease